jgi:histidinol-phosphate aminotransferase
MNKNFKNIIKLSANENFYGCSPSAKDAMKKFSWDTIHYYPDLLQQSLKEKLASNFNLSSQNILLGVGAVGIIENIIQFLIKPGEEIITLERSFIAYWQLAGFHHRKFHFAEMSHFTCDINNIFPLVNDKTKAIFICNPNNPTGTIIPHNDLKILLKKIPSQVFVIVDEAYNEYVTDTTYPDSLQLLSEFPNLIILRSLSKIYGLAGLRIGYGIATEKVTTELEKKRLPFSINSIASVAAMASLDDKNFIEECKMKNKTEREFLFCQLKRKGYCTLPSQANFIFLYFQNNNEKEDVFKRLFENSIRVCDLKIFKQDRSLRIAVADRTVNEIIVDSLV